MDGFAGSPALWQEARNADGRVYYYNTQTKATQWTKPEELMTPAERALANQPWKEYTAEGGRKYWSNTESKASTWEMPEVYKHALAQAPSSATLPPKPATPSAVPFMAGSGSYGALARQDDFPDRNERQGGFGPNEANGVSRGPTFQKPSGPDYSSYEEAEAAFFKMLRRNNVGADWTWEQTVRVVVKDPQYQAVKDPRDRKTAFEKYVSELRTQEKDRAKERLEKLRTDFGKMLRSHSEIKHYTRWKTARPIIEREAIFRSTNNDDERRALFEEYIIDLKKAHVEREVATRKSAIDELTSILKGLDLEPYTRWSEANEKIRTNPNFASDEKFRHLSRSDVLNAFENHIKALERTFNDERQRVKSNKARLERQRRDAFIDLLRELRTQGHIKAGTKWSTVHPLLQADSRYTSILGQPGSTPLDLFRDIVEEEERALRLLRNDVYDVLEDRRYEVNSKTSLADFQKLMTEDRRTRTIPEDSLSLIFTRLQDKVSRRAEDDKHASERAQRRAVDALRSRIKRLSSPAVRADSTWDSTRAQLERLEEFTAVESEEARRSAFDKVVRRLREKEEDIDRERAARRDRRRGAAPPRRTPSPAPPSERGEVDAYEADRRKAVADRERQFRKSSRVEPPHLPSPPRSSRRLRDYDSGDDPRDRRYRGGRDELNYDDAAGRERERERGERDRGERDRGDRDRGEREKEERRRRRPDSEDSVGSARKRVRRDGKEGRDEEKKREREKKEKEEREKKEEVAMRSGSEEGEMVEE